MDQPIWLTTAELASREKVSKRTVQGWRQRGVGPRPTLLEGALRYALVDVEEWERQQRSAAPDAQATGDERLQQWIDDFVASAPELSARQRQAIAALAQESGDDASPARSA